jgi:RNA polymerase sigma-70 factor (ECF subfamily)
MDLLPRGVIMTDETQTRQAFEAFIVPHLRMLWRLARRQVREPADAEDLVQETCLKAFRSFHQFCPGSNAKAWLVTILLNTSRDRTRKVSHLPLALSFDEIAEFVQLRHPTGTPETKAMQNNLGHLVRLAIDDLPPEFRLVVLLADVEGFTYQEIADTIGCPIGTVMSRLYRGRRLLHTTLHALIEE